MRSTNTTSPSSKVGRIGPDGIGFQSAIAKDTDYLVVGKNVGASKLAKADKLGTKQIGEDDLLTML